MKAVARTKKRTGVPSQVNVPYWVAKRARTDLPSRRGLVDDSKLRPCCSPPCPRDSHGNNRRDWAGLDDGVAGLIAERVLLYDVADYVRFRAVCRPWRECCSERRSHGTLDRRFHPRKWTMLWEELAAPTRRCFVNTFTGECVQVDIPQLHDYELLSITPEGLLVLAHKPPGTSTVCLLNPLTRHLMQLPPLISTLVPSEYHDEMLPERDGLCLHPYYVAWGSGIANNDSTVVLCLSRLDMIGLAKPGDDHWTLLDCHGSGMTAAIMFEGRFYCVNRSGFMVLETGPPRLVVAAKLNIGVSAMTGCFHPINNCGELMLVHRRLTCWSSQLAAENELVRCYDDAYRVDLHTGKLFRVKSLGGCVVFMGMDCSLAVSLDLFPSGSITADTIYLSYDVDQRARAYHLANGSSEGRYKGNLVPRQHNLAIRLSLSVTL